ncbi:glycosyltransferase [Parasphingorhabdus sp.]|uniref:glycosyltransferase n=1 Tax=Parasphingorhabdus sp. TaxID=2709688 RepID=UPI003A90499B
MKHSAPIVHFLYEPSNGGLDRVAILLANGMAERGLPTELWLTKETGAVAHLISSAVKIRLVPTPKFGGRGLQLLLQIPSVARMIRKHRPRAIFSAGNQTNLSLAIARQFAGRGPTKIIQKLTNPVLRPGFGKWQKIARTWRFGMTANLGDMSLTLSEADAKNYAQIYPHAATKFHVVPNPYVTANMLSAGTARPLRGPGQPPRLLSVGRFVPQKDYMTLVAALALIAEHPWSLTILGDGPLLQDTKQQAEKLGLADRITFKGFVHDVTPFLSQSDILVLSSRWEGLPAVPIEALAAGCAIVATDCSDGLTELLSRTGQRTVPVEDPEALARAILDEIHSPQPVKVLIECASTYSIENSIEQHLKLLDKVCEAA